jgi:hypothetical protein
LTRAKTAPAKPWTNAKARARQLSPDEQWAADLAARILADAHPAQADGILDPHTRVAFCVGRGGAKTTTKRARGLIKCARIRRGIVVYCATSRAQAEELMWFKLKDLVEAYGVSKDFQFLDSKLRMTCLRTGATYRLFGIEDKRDAEKLRGQPFDELQLDECGSWDPRLLEHTIDRIAAPRLGERGGAIVIGGTPGLDQRGPFYEATRLGSQEHRPYAARDRPEFARWLKWSSHAWSLADVAQLPDAERRYPALVANWREALVQKERKGWADDHPVWMREHLGLWSADQTDRVFRYHPHRDGQPWNQWDPLGDRELEGLDALRAAVAALPKDVGAAFHYFVGMDMGTRDPFACNVLAFAPTDAQRRIFHIWCFERTGMYAKAIAEVLLGPELDHGKPAGVLGVIGWPDGVEMDADQATLDELAKVYGLRAKKAEKKPDYKFGAVELCNGDFVEGRLKIIKGSLLEQQLTLLQWKPDEYGMLREDKAQANHSTDCLIYGRRGIATLFDAGVVVAEKAATAPAHPDPQVAARLANRRDDADDGQDLDSLFDAHDPDDDGPDGGWDL